MGNSYKKYLKTWEEFEVEWYETHLDDSECEPDLSDYREVEIDGKPYWVLHEDYQYFIKMYRNMLAQRKYVRKNKEKVRAYQKQYREKNREVINSKFKVYMALRKDK